MQDDDVAVRLEDYSNVVRFEEEQNAPFHPIFKCRATLQILLHPLSTCHYFICLLFSTIF